ncbi:MAG: hypothetical protein AB4372_09175 [Xenococcus sp. (in: cyanobacteria)]
MKLPVQAQPIIRSNMIRVATNSGITPQIRRSCQARYVLTPLVGGTSPISLGGFSARRGCGRFVPNRCRRRARDSAHRCMSDHWDRRTISAIPETCLESSAVQDYDVTNLDRAIRQRICSVYNFPQTATVLVDRVTTGNTGCGRTERLGSLNIRCR